jgi:Asp-tRNA(Asn)/Glu-tRNA(Gln) amidotransferase A subunit family amidase
MATEQDREMTDLHYLSATEALHLFRTRQLSPIELMQAVVDRAEQVEQQVNAFSEQMFAEALDAAAAAEKRYGRGGKPRPLEGLPVAGKEELHLAGHSVSEGTLLRSPYTARTTSLLLQRIQAAGGILHARTTTSEFCCMPMSHTRRWGVTRNPWNLRAGTGGSSGGSAASLAAGTTTLATGTDIGGSLRAPASFAGVVAFKPPHGRNPIHPPVGRDPYQHHGPMARTVADTALLQNVTAGWSAEDSSSLRSTARIPAELGDVDGLFIAFTATPGDFPVDPEVRANTRAVAQALRAAGAIVHEVCIPWRLDDVKRALWAHFGNGKPAEILELNRRQPGLVTPYTLAFAEKGILGAAQVDTATGHALELAVQEQLDQVLEHHDALVLPTMGATSFVAGEDYVEAKLVVDGKELNHFSDASLTPVFNICSSHPVVAVPSGWASNMVPTGVQVVTRRWHDVMAFRVAATIEATMRTGFAGARTPQLKI